jgi:hypothetical protein
VLRVWDVPLSRIPIFSKRLCERNSGSRILRKVLGGSSVAGLGCSFIPDTNFFKAAL